MQPHVELRFVHPQLATLGARAGRVRWSRADGHGAWRVGVQLEEALPDDALMLVLALGRPSAGPPRAGRAGLLAAIAVVVTSALWLPLYLSARSDRDGAVAHALAADDAAGRARTESLTCVTERAGEQAARAAALPAAAPAPMASAAPPQAGRPLVSVAADEPPDAAAREALVRGLVEQAFHALEDAGNAALATARDAEADADADDDCERRALESLSRRHPSRPNCKHRTAHHRRRAGRSGESRSRQRRRLRRRTRRHRRQRRMRS